MGTDLKGEFRLTFTPLGVPTGAVAQRGSGTGYKADVPAAGHRAQEGCATGFQLQTPDQACYIGQRGAQWQEYTLKTSRQQDPEHCHLDGASAGQVR